MRASPPHGKGSAVGRAGMLVRIEAAAGTARRPAERVGERRRETHSLLRVQRFRRLVKIMPGGGLCAVDARLPFGHV